MNKSQRYLSWSLVSVHLEIVYLKKRARALVPILSYMYFYFCICLWYWFHNHVINYTRKLQSPGKPTLRFTVTIILLMSSFPPIKAYILSTQKSLYISSFWVSGTFPRGSRDPHKRPYVQCNTSAIKMHMLYFLLPWHPDWQWKKALTWIDWRLKVQCPVIVETFAITFSRL